MLPGDNAAIHHTVFVKGTMDEVFDGYYLFAAPYSPDLKAVERLFAEVKDILRLREDEAVLKPIATISEVFDSFRPGMLHSGMAHDHFRIYRQNHEMWLQEIAEMYILYNDLICLLYFLFY